MNKKLKSWLICNGILAALVMPVAKADSLSFFYFQLNKGTYEPVTVRMKMESGARSLTRAAIYTVSPRIPIPIAYESPLTSVDIEATVGNDGVCFETISGIVGPEDTVTLDVTWLPGEAETLSCRWYFNGKPV